MQQKFSGVFLQTFLDVKQISGCSIQDTPINTPQVLDNAAIRASCHGILKSQGKSVLWLF